MPPRARSTRSVNTRMTDADYAPIEARSEALGISTSQALRELIHFGAWHDRAQRIGVVMTDRAHELLADGRGALLRFVTPDSGITIEAQMPPASWDALEAGAALICAPEDVAE
jgi:hypothetical protein